MILFHPHRSIFVSVSRIVSRFWLITSTLVVGLLVVDARPAVAQSTSDETTADLYREGLQAFDRGNHDRARTLLEDVVRVNAAFQGTRGAGVYWLGRAHQRLGQRDSMSRAWAQGVRAFRAAGRFDVRLFDAHLRRLAASSRQPSTEATGQITTLYLEILDRVATDHPADDRRLLHRHVAQFLPLVDSDTLEAFLRRGSPQTPSDWRFDASVEEWMRQWWQRQDPSPATPFNERIHEHLHRVATASVQFSSDERLRGWDERGDLYVRLGKPDRRVRIPFDDVRLMREVVRPGVSVTPQDFPDHEIWVYPGMSGVGRYLFVRQNGTYATGTVIDLLPEPLRGPFAAGERHQNRAYSAMAALGYIYDHLSVHYHDTGSIADRIAAWFEFQQASESLSEARRRSGQGAARGLQIGYGSGARQVFQGPGPGQGLPSTAARTTLTRAVEQERYFARRRSDRVPQQRTTSTAPTRELPIAFRTARFRDRSGATVTEIYWGREHASPNTQRDANDHPASGSRDEVLTTAAVRYDTEYGRASSHRDTVFTTGDDYTPGGPRKIKLNGTNAPYHLAVQWDQFVSLPSSKHDLGANTRRTVRWRTNIPPLDVNPDRLTMSDLKPMVLPSEPPPADIEQAAFIHPYEGLSTAATLLLVFEIYDLKTGRDNRTQWTVEYEMARKVEKGFLARLFGSNYEVERTATSTSFSGSTRQTREAIVLDLSGRRAVEPGELTVTVRVTDGLARQTVERDIQFQLVPPSE